MSDPRHVQLLMKGLLGLTDLITSYFKPPQVSPPSRPKAEVINLEARRAMKKRKTP